MLDYLKLMGSGPNDLSAAIHGFLGFILFGAFVWAVEAVSNNSPAALLRLKKGSLVMVLSSFLCIAYGNVVYIAYRAKDGVQPWLKAQNIYYYHSLGMELKEFVALFTFPLAVAIAYTVYTMSEDWFASTWARNTVRVALFAAILYTFAALGLGAMITKAKAV
jgi:hypothetical protein